MPSITYLPNIKLGIYGLEGIYESQGTVFDGTIETPPSETSARKALLFGRFRRG
jgi:hypothetical protein